LFTLIAWLTGLLIFGRLKVLEPSHLNDDGAGRKISLIIPARNEEKNIGKLLESISKQKTVPHEVIVVDDNSSDGTAEIVSGYNVKLVKLESDPPAGWIGKSWACWNGYLASVGDVLVFLDADVELSPEALGTIVNLQELKGGLFSVQPYHRMERFYESFSLVFNLIVVASLGNFMAGERNAPGAFGPCMVCSRSDYSSLGGHEAIKSNVLDDIGLGRTFWKNGLPVSNTLGGEMISFRMYPGGIGEVLKGWGKNFAKGAGSTPPLTLIMMVLWITGVFSTFLRLPVALGFQIQFIAFIIMYLAYAVQIYLYSRKIGSFSIGHALIFPVYFLFFFYTFIYSGLRTLLFKRVSWKGRDIDV
jgi:4,4'-diaponeurosporenoate glycosyltransferase